MFSDEIIEENSYLLIVQATQFSSALIEAVLGVLNKRAISPNVTGASIERSIVSVPSSSWYET